MLTRTEIWLREHVRTAVVRWRDLQVKDIWGEYYAWYANGSIVVAKEAPAGHSLLLCGRLTPDLAPSEAFKRIMDAAWKVPCLPIEGVS